MFFTQKILGLEELACPGLTVAYAGISGLGNYSQFIYQSRLEASALPAIMEALQGSINIPSSYHSSSTYFLLIGWSEFRGTCFKVLSAWDTDHYNLHKRIHLTKTVRIDTEEYFELHTSTRVGCGTEFACVAIQCEEYASSRKMTE